LFGALPLAVESGTGAELRFPLGISIIGGLLLSQLLTLYTTPVIYLYLDHFSLWCRRRWSSAHRPVTASDNPLPGE
jgi:Cu/Ag efflux pump CusA